MNTGAHVLRFLCTLLYVQANSETQKWNEYHGRRLRTLAEKFQLELGKFEIRNLRQDLRFQRKVLKSEEKPVSRAGPIVSLRSATTRVCPRDMIVSLVFMSTVVIPDKVTTHLLNL